MSWFGKLKQALSKTSDSISSSIHDILNKKKLDDTDIDNLEEILLMADLGVEATKDIIDSIKNMKFDENISSNDVKEKLSHIISDSIEPYQNDFTLKSGLNVVLVCGVNGNGKTTTIGKLAHFYMQQGKKVSIAACDTFRAAATEQVSYFAKKLGCKIVTAENSGSSDPASVAYIATKDAIESKDDILLIDTAGRLHNNKGLMEELAKITKVIGKLDQSAPHHTLLVLDATTGQNAFSQLSHFTEISKVTGLIVTKLDGTAKGGIIIGLCKQFKLPVYFIGLGEQIDDLKPFSPKEFSKALVG